ncbi:Lyso-phosphatidylcholine acyltransferase [Coemansia sp. Benny D115]|nr:Lyso-phosphatidylcholine acyltransferase [Coemansia sp. Benny D115]
MQPTNHERQHGDSIISTEERQRPGAEELIDKLPLGSKQEQSFAYWARKQLDPYDIPWWRPLSSAVVGATTGAMSALLHLGFRKVVTEDLHKLTNVIEDPHRTRPVVTIANHESTMDDPIMWGVLPARMWFNPDHARWTLGARELLYKNPVLNGFFALGQTIPTVRGDGIYQLAVEIGLRKLTDNKWLHVFPEGRVNQTNQFLRFKWGVGRLIMESERTPIVIPMYFRGMREVMPLRQKVPIPRPNPFQSAFYMKIGDEIDFTAQVEAWRTARSKLTLPEDKERLDEHVRIEIVNRLWQSLDKLKTDSSPSVASLFDDSN